jgi:signal transduction histidine kinase/CheY-like chemotaxis protein
MAERLSLDVAQARAHPAYRALARQRVAVRATGAFALLLACAGVSTVFEILRFPERQGAMLAFDAVVLAIAFCALAMVRVRADWGIPVLIACVNAVGVALIAYHAIVGAEIAMCVLTLTALLASSALLLPWGWRAQALASIGVVASYPLLFLRGEDGVLTWAVGGMYLAWVLGLSTLGAAFIEGYLATDFARAVEREDLLAREQAARRDAEEASEAKDHFMAKVSHELRTPLSAIVGWTAILADSGVNEDTRRRALDAIERSGRSLAQLTDDLVDVARIASGKLRLGIKLIEIAPVVQLAIEAMRPTSGAKGVVLTADLATGDHVLGDPGRLQQVVWNLVSNAIKFTDAGGRVAVELERVGDLVELRVRDTGCGIDPELLPHVFEPFWQGDAEATHPHGGLGLGLAIVRQLVELHGGTISVASPRERRGAEFTVRLPIATGLAGAQGTETASSETLRGVSVLVVDDEEDAQHLARTALELRGVEVRIAASTVQALELLEHWTPTVLVSDIAMPNDDGYSLIREVRARERTRGGHLPAVAFTALVRAEDRSRMVAAGFDGYVAKPFDPSTLVQAVAGAASTPQHEPSV